MTISEATATPPVRSERLIFRPQEDCALIYHAGTDQLYTMQPLGVEILNLCDGARSVRQIAAEALGDKPEPAVDREAIVRRFLHELEQRQLITWAGRP